jgi:hypothetical protein
MKEIIKDIKKKYNKNDIIQKYLFNLVKQI